MLLRSVAASAHLKLHVDSGTEARLMKVLSRLEAERTPLEEVLAALLGGDVAWELHGKTLSVHGTESAGHEPHHSTAHSLGISPGKCQGNVSAHGMPDNGCLLDVQIIEQSRNIRSIVIHAGGRSDCS